jgi:hypothetical protein
MFCEQYSHEPNIATLRFWTHQGWLVERAALVPGSERAGWRHSA